MDSLHEGADAGEVRRTVTDLGLRHHLVTDYTSLVAVDEQAAAPRGTQPVTRIVPVNPPREDETVEDVITVTAESPLLDERRLSTGATVSQAELAKIPTPRDQAVWSVDGTVITDMTALGSSPAYYDFDAFEEMRSTLSEAEAKALCAEIQRTGWAGITLEQALAAAPSLREDLRKAAGAGLLRGFLAGVLHGRGCSEPPADVLAEAQQYVDRFGRPKG